MDHPVISELGGDGTVEATGDSAFSLPVRGLSEGDRSVFLEGEGFFRRDFAADDGLGPTFVTTACSGCHVRDGRGSPLDAGDGSLLRVDPGAVDIVDSYGRQIQTEAVPGVNPEAVVGVDWVEEKVELDGLRVSLRRPELVVGSTAFGDIDATELGLRVAPALHGSGLLELVSDQILFDLEDPNDEDGDGVSGRVSMVGDVVGRFGWKASEPTITGQVVEALHEDMGVTSPQRREENCPPVQTACREQPPGVPLTDQQVGLLASYVRMLGVPAARDWENPDVQAGFEVFTNIGCDGCHTPTMSTGERDVASLSGQTIHPFTDLLLHDMGEELAEPFSSERAAGSEWRTPPLWGIGLTETVSGHSYFLHDGRARNVVEAILWHGGEAQQSRDAFRDLTEDQRERLLDFLDSI